VRKEGTNKTLGLIAYDPRPNLTGHFKKKKEKTKNEDVHKGWEKTNDESTCKKMEGSVQQEARHQIGGGLSKGRAKTGGNGLEGRFESNTTLLNKRKPWLHQGDDLPKNFLVQFVPLRP